jgi:quercetin dioxygenase-like cupin family protein
MPFNALGKEMLPRVVSSLFRRPVPAQGPAANDAGPAAPVPAPSHEDPAMKSETAGITKANTGIDGISWNILGQTYVPKTLTDQSFSWHATLPAGTFVPPHIHPTQDEYIYLFEGKLDLVLDGRDYVAAAGDLIRLPMGVAHGIFNRSDQTAKCLFWVTPTRKLYDLFWGIHMLKEQKPDEVVALSAKHEVMFLPPPAS